MIDSVDVAGTAQEGISGRPRPVVGRDAVVAQLERILASSVFATAPRLSRFLRYVVEKHVAGQTQDIKEYSIAIEVYDRKTDYDPQVDSTVRAEASRLRKRLGQYYESIGQQDPVVITLPVGSYIPMFEQREPRLAVLPTPPSPATPAVALVRKTPVWIFLSAAATALIVLGFWFYRSPRPVSAPPVQSIAVLPFVSLGTDPHAARIADGLTEELTDRLGRLAGIRVTAASLMARYKTASFDLVELGKTLRINAFLEGSVRAQQDRVLVSARLIDTQDGYQIWAETFDRTGLDRLTIEREIGTRIAGAIENRAAGAVPLSGTRKVEDPEVMTAYLTAYELLRNQTTEARRLWPREISPKLLESIRLFEKATRASPGFAKAWVGLGEAHELVFELDRTHPATRLAAARAALDKAVTVDNTLADAHSARCSLLLYRERDFAGAESSCRRAIELNPRDVLAEQRYINLLRIQGRFAEARSEMARALQLQPTAPGLRVQNSLLLFDDNRFDESIAEAKKAESLNSGKESPHYAMALWMQGQNYEQKRDFAAAEREYRRGLAASPFDRWCEPALARVLFLTRQTREAEPILRRLEEQREHGNPMQLALALSYTAMNRNAQALDLLEEGFRDLDPSVLFLRVEKRLSSLATEPRYEALLAQVTQKTARARKNP